MSTEETMPQDEAKEKSSKIDKAYKEMVAKLTAVAGDEKKVPKRKSRVANDRVTTLVDEMLKERAENLEKEFKTKASAFFESVIKFHLECEEAEALYKKTVEDKKAALTKEGNQLFKQIENVDKLKESYIKSLKSSAGQ